MADRSHLRRFRHGLRQRQVGLLGYLVAQVGRVTSDAKAHRAAFLAQPAQVVCVWLTVGAGLMRATAGLGCVRSLFIHVRKSAPQSVALGPTVPVAGCQAPLK